MTSLFFFFFFFFVDKRLYIKRKEEVQKTVPSKYTGSIQKQPKDSNQRGRDRNTSPPLTESLTNQKNLQEKNGSKL